MQRQYVIPPGIAQRLTTSQQFLLKALAHRLMGLYSAPKETTTEEGLRIWRGVHEAYQDLRGSFVDERRSRTPAKKHDPTLDKFLEDRERFWNLFYGRRGPDGKRVGCADKTVRVLIERYQKARNYYYPLTEDGKKAKKRANKRQAKKPEVRAAKEAWRKSDAGKAWWANHRAEAKKKRAAARLDNALQDLRRLSEQHEAAEALASVDPDVGSEEWLRDLQEWQAEPDLSHLAQRGWFEVEDNDEDEDDVDDVDEEEQEPDGWP